MKSPVCNSRVESSVICCLACVSIAFAVQTGCAASAQWPQWGGPNRNFMLESAPLADSWPEEGPRRIWHRELGDGYSTIVVDDDVLYTTYRTNEDEFTVALDANTGKTIWEHKNPSPFTSTMGQFGPGPHSTPLIVGNRLFTIGTNALLNCFDRRTGEVLWKHDLPGEFGAPIPERGYACSPIAYKGTVIVPVDRQRPDEDDDSSEENREDEETEAKENVEGQTLVAFDQATGEVVWKSQDYPVPYSSPVLIDFDGQEQLVFLMQHEMIGVNPADGELLWKHEFDPEGFHCATPLWTGDDLLFVSSAYGVGSRVIRLVKKDGKTVPEELWYNKKLRIHHGNAIRIGDYVYGSSGDFGAALFMGINIHTGERLWVNRDFAKATCLYADGKLIILDEDGQLALATATPEGLTVHSKCKVATEEYAWAAPTLVGTTLYVRDRQHIMALDLG